MVILSILFYFFVVPVLGFLDWINWWNGEVGKMGQDYDCLDMYALAYKINAANWVYDLYSLNQTGIKAFSGNTEAEFIMTLLMTESSLVRPSNTSIGPYQMCQSIAPTGRQYEWPQTVDGWRYLVGKWLGMSEKEVDGFESVGDMKTYEKYADPKTWETKYESENFLFQSWGFTWNSPLIVAFITKWPNLPDEDLQLLSGTLLTQMLDKELGQPDLPGGWMGLLKVYLTSSDTRSLADVETYLFSSVAAAPKWYTDNKNAKKDCSWTNYASATASGAGLLVGGAGAGAMIGSAFPPFGTIIGGVIGGIIGAVAGAVGGVASVEKSCKP